MKTRLQSLDDNIFEIVSKMNQDEKDSLLNYLIKYYSISNSFFLRIWNLFEDTGERLESLADKDLSSNEFMTHLIDDVNARMEEEEKAGLLIQEPEDDDEEQE